MVRGEPDGAEGTEGWSEDSLMEAGGPRVVEGSYILSPMISTLSSLQVDLLCGKKQIEAWSILGEKRRLWT